MGVEKGYVGGYDEKHSERDLEIRKRKRNGTMKFFCSKCWRSPCECTSAAQEFCHDCGKPFSSLDRRLILGSRITPKHAGRGQSARSHSDRT